MTRKEIGIIEELFHYYLDCKFQSETEDESDFYEGIMGAIEELEDRLGINTSEYWLEEEMKKDYECWTVIGNSHTGKDDAFIYEIGSLEEAREEAKKLDVDYDDIYIRKETDYIYKLS